MDRRQLLKLGAGAITAAALGGGMWVQTRRDAEQRESSPISEHWPARNGMWLQPNLRDVKLVVPDRPHRIEEVVDADARARVRRRRTFYVTTSQRRLRDDTYAWRVEPGKFRLLVLGDSITFGWGVAGRDAWPARLVGELASRGVQAEVLNAGMPSLRVEGMVDYVRGVAGSLGVHGMVFARRPVPTADRYEAYALAVRACQRVLSKARFHVLLPAASTFDVDVFIDHADQYAQVASRVSAPVTDLTDTFIQRRASSSLGTGGVIAEGTPAAHLVRSIETGAVLLRGTGGENGCLGEEVYAAFEATPSWREPFFFDQGHPDEEGHALTAATMADALVREGMFG